MKNKITAIGLIFSVLLLFSCKENREYSKIESKQSQSVSNLHKVVIEEYIDGGSYAYIFVNESGNKYWMSLTNMEVEVGNTYYYEGGMVMKNFESKHLKRTFNFITFVNEIRTSEIVKVTDKPNKEENKTKLEEDIEKIEQPKGGKSLESIFQNKASLNKKNITVRGKVIKVNNGIMDKNWVHISDGTQLEGKKSLTVTTQATVKVGEIVTLNGILTLDKDFGYGYVYDILLEEGELIQ